MTGCIRTTGDKAGAHAEYVAVPADGIVVHQPANINDEYAAALPVGALTALYFLRKANIKQGQKVLVYGASGSVGTYAVQLAKHFNAEVTGVCSHANSELVRSLGAGKVIDYKKEDFTVNREEYDIIFDAVGKAAFSKSKMALKPGGVYLTVAMNFSLILQSSMAALTGRYRLISAVAKPAVEELRFLADLLAAGKLKPVIDRTYSLSDIRMAHKHAETGHKKGNIVLTPMS